MYKHTIRSSNHHFHNLTYGAVGLSKNSDRFSMAIVGGNLPAVVLAGHGMDFESLDLQLGLLLISCLPLPRARRQRDDPGSLPLRCATSSSAQAAGYTVA